MCANLARHCEVWELCVWVGGESMRCVYLLTSNVHPGKAPEERGLCWVHLCLVRAKQSQV